MVKISNNECKELLNLGVKMGENGISKTVGSGKRRTYYMTESEVNMALLYGIQHGSDEDEGNN